MKNRKTTKMIGLLAMVFLLMAAIYAPVMACEETDTNTQVNRTVTNNDSLDFSGSLTISAQLNFLMGLLDAGKEPAIEISPISLDFGDVEYMTESDKEEITISNEGDGDLVMAFRDFEGVNDEDQQTGDDDRFSDDTRDYDLTSDGLDYDEADKTYTLEPGESGTITVVFQPRTLATAALPSYVCPTIQTAPKLSLNSAVRASSPKQPMRSLNSPLIPLISAKWNGTPSRTKKRSPSPTAVKTTC